MPTIKKIRALFYCISASILALSMFSVSSTAFAINKCVDSAGKVSYSDRPCESGSKKERIETRKKVEQPKRLPSPGQESQRGEKEKSRTQEELREKAKEIAHGGKPEVDDRHLTNKTINSYKYRASFAQALAAIGPIKTQAAIYASENGRFPQEVGDIGFTREDMRTSSFFSDLRFGTNGEILVQGNSTLGENSVIRLEPRFTLGGTTIEWRCTTNAEKVDSSMCDYDKSVTF